MQIEKGVPLPQIASTYRKELLVSLDKMDAGDSVLITKEDTGGRNLSGVAEIARGWAVKHSSKIATQREVGGIRVWIVERGLE